MDGPERGGQGLPGARDRTIPFEPSRVNRRVMNLLPFSVGVQWELRRAVARRDQSHALGFFLNPAPLDRECPDVGVPWELRGALA